MLVPRKHWVFYGKLILWALPSYFSLAYAWCNHLFYRIYTPVMLCIIDIHFLCLFWAAENDITEKPIDPIKVYSEKELVREIEKIASTLVPEKDWSIRIAAMQRVEGLVSGGLDPSYLINFLSLQNFLALYFLNCYKLQNFLLCDWSVTFFIQRNIILGIERKFCPRDLEKILLHA